MAESEYESQMRSVTSRSYLPNSDGNTERAIGTWRGEHQGRWRALKELVVDNRVDNAFADESNWFWSAAPSVVGR